MKATHPDVRSIVNELPDAVKPGRESKLIGPVPKLAARVAREILEGGAGSLNALIDLVRDSDLDQKRSYKPGHALRLVVLEVGSEGRRKSRELLSDVIARRLDEPEAPEPTRRRLIRELQLIADKRAVPTLEKLLDSNLCEPATQALSAIGQDASPALRRALERAKGDRLRTIIQALGILRDSEASAMLTKLTDDVDDATRLAAATALANIGEESAVTAVLKTSDESSGWTRQQATKACIVLAERLAEANNSDGAKRIYRHLRETRTAETERYVGELAQRALDGMEP